MVKYLLRYLFFWLPAVLIAYFFNNETMLSQVLQWFFAFFMVFGWSVNTAMAAYYLPRSTLSALLTYTGFNILVIVFMYTAYTGSGLYILLHGYGGILSFTPLDIMVQALRPFVGLPWEIIVTLFLAACCSAGYITGIVRRRVHPNPYSPRIRRSRG